MLSDSLSFIYEPYSIGFILALILTGIYFLMNRMNGKKEEEEVSEDSENKVGKNKRKQKSEMSYSVKSILIFISSFVSITGAMYFYKNMKSPIESIPVLSEIKEQISGVLDTNNIGNMFNSQNEEKIIEDILSKENPDEIFTVNQEIKKKRMPVDETFIAGKNRKKNRELKHVLSKEAKYVDNDIDLTVSPF